MKPKLQIPKRQIWSYHERYGSSDELKLAHLRHVKREPGYLTPDELFTICHWKSTRRASLALRNSPELVKEITSFAFKAECEESKIGSLTVLEGVSFPTASVILHFCADETYPILDFRTLWSLGIKKPSVYTTAFWIEYVQCCRNVAEKYGLSVRQLDRALWQYSRDHQNA